MRLSDARFADLHCRVVPGVDGGSPSVVKAIQSLRALRSEGVGALVLAQPLEPARHPGSMALRRRLDELQAGYERMCEAAAGRLDVPVLHSGQVIRIVDADDVRRVAEDPRVGLGGSRFLLVEFDRDLRGEPLKLIRAVRSAGRELLVSHPERCRFPWSPNPLDTVRRWVDAGAYLQVGLASLAEGGGACGADAEALAWSLLEAGLVHALSSGAHVEVASLPVQHRAVLGRLARCGGARQAAQLLGGNPRRVLRDQLPSPVAPLRVPLPV
ncbi:MAG: CpsB/CapC family capsule biosynthesis tyrosine phosphatase [Gemmatimonadota bacterium]